MRLFIFLLICPLFLTISESQMAGGWSLKPSNESPPDKIIQYLLTNISTTSEKWSLDEVLSYQTQVVAGTNHKLVLQIKSSAGTKKVIFAIIYEGLGDVRPLSVNRLYDVVYSNQNNLQKIANNDILLDLKSKIVRIHEYYSMGKIKFNVRKIRWALSFTTQNNEENYYVNYELEGTNNEVSLWEHWFRKLENKNALDASLYSVKLPLAKFTATEYTAGQGCQGVQSYLMCGVNDCNKKGFLTEGKCVNNEINA